MRFMRSSSVQIFSNRKQRLDDPVHSPTGRGSAFPKMDARSFPQVAARFSVTSVLFLSALCGKAFSLFPGVTVFARPHSALVH
jgi:hypothetical protein